MGNAGTGLHLAGAGHDVVDSNIFFGNGASGIDMTGIASQDVIRSNLIYGNLNGITSDNSENTNFVGNTIASNTVNGVKLTNSPTGGNNFIANRIFNNGANGVSLNQAANVTLISDSIYNNAIDGIYISQSPTNNVMVNEALGYSPSAASWPDGNLEIEFDTTSASGLLLRGGRLNPAHGVNSQNFAQAGAYLLSFGLNQSTGIVQLQGDFALTNGPLNLDYGSDINTSNAFQFQLIKGVGHSASADPNNTYAVSQLVSIIFDSGSGQWNVMGSASGSLGQFSGSISAQPFPSSNPQFFLTFTPGASPQNGDEFDFLLVESSHDANVQKKILFGLSATTGSSWNNNSGRSKIEIAPGGVFEASGTIANPTIITMQSGSTYYSFVDSGTFQVQHASFTDMDENGIWLSGSGNFSMDNTTFDYVGSGLSSTSTLISLNDVTNSTTTIEGPIFGNSHPNAQNYNFTIRGSSVGLQWSILDYNGALAGSSHTRNDPLGRIVWGTEIPPGNPQLTVVSASSITAVWDGVWSLAGYSLEASTSASFSTIISSVSPDEVTTLSLSTASLSEYDVFCARGRFGRRHHGVCAHHARIDIDAGQSAAESDVLSNLVDDRHRQLDRIRVHLGSQYVARLCASGVEHQL